MGFSFFFHNKQLAYNSQNLYLASSAPPPNTNTLVLSQMNPWMVGPGWIFSQIVRRIH